MVTSWELSSSTGVILQLAQHTLKRGLCEPLDLSLVGPGHMLMSTRGLREGLITTVPMHWL